MRRVFGRCSSCLLVVLGVLAGVLGTLLWLAGSSLAG